MIARLDHLAVTVTSLLLAPAVMQAQPQSGIRRNGDFSLGSWMGVSVSSLVGAHLSATPHRELFLSAIRGEYLAAANRRMALSFTVDLFPLAVVRDNPEWRLVINPNTPTGPREDRVEIGRGAVLGVGIAPVGLQFSVHPLERAGIVAGASGGALWFASEVPVSNARRMNYTVDASAALELSPSTRYRVRVGYRFHHLSNARTAPQNPGLDSKIVFVGALVGLE